MRKVLVVTALTLASATLAWSAGPKPAAPARKEVGNLATEGVPEIPARVADRTMQYQNTRGAGLLDFAPDGKGVLIATRFASTAQVHVVAAPGADRQQLTFYNEPVADAFFDEARGAGGFYFSKDIGGNENHQLYWYDRKGGQATLLTDGKSKNQSFIAAEGGGMVAFASTLRNAKDFDIYVKEGDAGPRLVKQVEGQWTPVAFSKDRKKLLVTQDISVNETYVWVVDVATGEATELNPQAGKKKIGYGDRLAWNAKGDGVYYAADEDAEFRQLTYYELATGKKTVLTADRKWDVSKIAVSRDGKLLAYTVNEGGAHALYLASTAAPKKARKVALPPGVIAGLRFDAQSRRLGLSMTTATAPSDVYTVDPKSLKLTRWTTSEMGGLDPATFVEPKLISFASFDKLEVPAWYYKPRPAAAGKPVPVIIDIHGGPEGQSAAVFSPITQYLVNELGVAVILPNVRGSEGYGKSYLQLDNGMKREDSVKDIGALLDWIAAQPELDKSRVAVQGGSYGGFMVLASLVKYSDRLRCGVDIVGISHFVTFLNNTEDYRRDLRRVEYGDERDPEMKKFLDRISPLTNAKAIKVPLYVIQGLNDPRVPASEAEQMVKTVRAAGGMVWYLLARDEGHGFRKKPNRDFMSNSMVLFYEEFLVK